MTLINRIALIHPRRLRVRLCSVLAIALLAACGPGGQSEEPTPTPLPTPIVPEKPTYVVARGTVTKTLEFTGRVSPVTQQELFFRAEGFVRAVHVSRDDRVNAGDILAELEIGDLENQLAQARLNLLKAERQSAEALAAAQIALEKARLRLQQAQAEDVAADVIRSQIALTQTREALAYAQDEYNKAINRPWEPQDVLEAYQRSVTEAERNLAVAQAEYDRALAAQRSHAIDIALLRQDVALAELQLARLQSEGEELVDLDVEQAKLDVKKIEDQIAAASLVAPFDGQVLSLNIRAGSAVEAFKVVALVGDPDTLEITADLDAGDVSELSVNQSAIIRLRDRPGQDFTGTVRQLPYVGGGATAGGTSDDTAVRIALDDAGVTLELGELATVIVVLEKKDNVLWLPPAAIRAFQGRDFVVIQDGAVQRRVDVRLGIRGEDRVEILEGVEEGQVVIGP